MDTSRTTSGGETSTLTYAGEPRDFKKGRILLKKTTYDPGQNETTEQWQPFTATLLAKLNGHHTNMLHDRLLLVLYRILHSWL